MKNPKPKHLTPAPPPIKLSPKHWEIAAFMLSRIYVSGKLDTNVTNMSVNRAAHALGCSAGVVRRVLDRMVAQGYLQRSEYALYYRKPDHCA